MRLGVSPMRARIIGAAVLVGAALAVVASTASGGTQAANSITVWLQVDAQATNWEPIVKAANAAFQKDHPGVAVNVQYQTWGNHLQKFDATLAGGSHARRHRDGEHRDDEVHGRGSVPGPDVREGLAAELRHVARRACRVQAATAGSSTASRTTQARASSPTAPTSSRRPGSRCRRASRSSRRAGRSWPPRTSRRGSRRCTSPARTGTSRWASSTTSAARSRRR